MSLTKKLFSDIPFIAYRTEDPLSWVKVPYLDEYVVPHLSFLGDLQIHIHQVVAVTLFYHAIYLIAVYSYPLLFPKRKISLSLTREFGIHVVSTIQSVIIIGASLPALRYSDDPFERVFGQTPYGAMLASLATLYFIWDAAISLLYSGFGFFIHGLVSTIVFGIGVYPYILYYAPIFLLFELSNPFLNLRWFGIKFPGWFGDKFQLINNIVLITIFFFARLFWGWYQVINLAFDFYAVRHDPRFNLAFTVIILLCNLVLDVLNIYWFYRMILVAIRILRQMFSKKGGEKSSEKRKNI